MSAARRRLPAAVTIAAVAVLPRTRLLEPVQAADERLLAALVAHRHPGWRRPARWLTAVAEPPAVTLAWSAAALWHLHHDVPASILLRSGVPAAAGIAARRVLAEAIRRPRPPAAWWWAEPSGFSYPSRHVTWALLGLGSAVDLALAPGRHAARVPGSVLAVTIVVATTRLVLALHWPSDVAAAVAFGTAWRGLSPQERTWR